METFKPIKKQRECGFTLIEVMMAIAVMGFGLLAVAALMSQMSVSTNSSRYMGQEAMLASEKLEDLNHYPSSDTRVCAPPAAPPCGSLTADVPGYFDQIQVSTGSDSSGGSDISETNTFTDASGNPQYTRVAHNPNGTVTSGSTNAATGATPPAPTADMQIYDRRWIVEPGVPINGVRRITVLVRLAKASSAGQQSFQMSMVRP
jgi:prepilin-type N-terminal cleavage/methylation domain-containing protein